MTTEAPRYEIVALLQDLSYDNDSGKFIHRDGQPFTASEMDLIGQAGRDELIAARNQLVEEAKQQEKQANLMRQLKRLADPYFDQLGDSATLTDAVEVMPPPAKNEAQRLLEEVNRCKLT